MSVGFDPYHKWLGIPPKDQPPNCYRLLGVELLEGDLDVIENAADQRMRHVRSFQNGQHSAESQRLLNEIAQAKMVLLDPRQKNTYDGELARHRAPPIPVAALRGTTPSHAIPPVAASTAQAIPPVVQPKEAAPATTGRAPAAPRRPGRKKDPRLEVAKHVVASVAGLAIAFIILGFLRADWDTLGIARGVRGALGFRPRALPPEDVVSPDPIDKPDIKVRPKPPDRNEQPDLTKKQTPPTPPKNRPSSPPRVQSLTSTQQTGWQTNAEPKLLGPAHESFVGLSSVGGCFLGSGEWFSVQANTDARWLISGGAFQPVGMSALTVKTPVRWMFEDEVREYQWTKGMSPVKLIDQREGFAVLSGVTGCFLGPEHEVRVYLENGVWYLHGQTNFDTRGRALVYRFRGPGKFQAQVIEHAWSQGNNPLELLHASDGLCFISGMSGAYKGWGEIGYCEIDNASQRWVLRGQSSQPTMRALCTEIKFGVETLLMAAQLKEPPRIATTTNPNVGPIPIEPMPKPMPMPMVETKAQPPDEAAIAAAQSDLQAEIDAGNGTALLAAARQRAGVERYVLFLAARDKLAATGACAAALQVCDSLSAEFVIDLYDVKTETLQKLRGGCETPDANRELAQQTIQHFDQGVTLGRKGALPALAELAISAARKSEDPALTTRATLKLLEARK